MVYKPKTTNHQLRHRFGNSTNTKSSHNPSVKHTNGVPPSELYISHKFIMLIINHAISTNAQGRRLSIIFRIIFCFYKPTAPYAGWPRVLLLRSLLLYLPAIELETVKRTRPLARRRAKTLRPSADAIRARKPCLFTRLRLWGWNVLFIITI